MSEVSDLFPALINRSNISLIQLDNNLLLILRGHNQSNVLFYMPKVHKSVGFGRESRRLAQRHPKEATVADAHLWCAQLLEVVAEVVAVNTLHSRG